MSDYWEAWWYGGDIYDRRTREHVEALAASQARARSRLAEQMRQQSGNLQAQIDRLTRAFVALVEYEDVRGELNQYADAAAVRRYAREVVAGVAMTGGASVGTLLAPPDVHAYWLAPASRAVALLSRGPDAEGDRLVEEAARRDRRRTAYFLVLLDAVTRQPRWTDRYLDEVLPAAPELTVAQRALWVAATEDRLGAAAAERYAEALAKCYHHDAAAQAAWLDQLSGERHAPTGVEQAGERIAAVRRLVGADAAADGGHGTPSAPPADGTSAPEDPLADCLRSLVDQGAPGEAEILSRMDEVREQMGFVTARRSEHEWDSAAGAVADLLRADLADPSVPPPRRRLALRILGPHLLSYVDDLSREVGVTLPATRSTMAQGLELQVREDGGVTPEDWREQVVGAVRRRYGVPSYHRPAALAAAGAAVVCAVLALLVHPALWLLTAAAGVAAAVLWSNRLGAVRTARDAETRAVASAEQAVRAAADKLRSERAALSAIAGRAAADRPAIAATVERASVPATG